MSSTAVTNKASIAKEEEHTAGKKRKASQDLAISADEKVQIKKVRTLVSICSRKRPLQKSEDEHITEPPRKKCHTDQLTNTQEEESGNSSYSSTSESDSSECFDSDNVKVIRLIGKGAFGTVQLVEDEETEKIMARKVLDSLQTTKFRFMTEVIAMQRLQANPLFPRLFDYRESAKSRAYHILMEYFSGETLFELTQRENLSTRAIQYIMIQIGRALIHMNKEGVTHRDIKPENILVDRDSGAVKIIDFGFAVVDEKADGYSGTPQFMAPEVRYHMKNRWAPKYDTRADIYSMGATMYSLYFGLPPFSLMCKYDNPRKVLADLDQGNIMLPRSNLSKTARHFLKRALHHRPEKRMSHEEMEKHPYFSMEGLSDIVANGLKGEIQSRCRRT